jgi:hypothetical protein
MAADTCPDKADEAVLMTTADAMLMSWVAIAA